MINGIICVAGPFCLSGIVISPKVSVVPSVLVASSDAPPNAPISEAETRVRTIPRYDLFARVQRLEDTMFSKADAKEMEKRAEAMEKRMEKRAEAMEKKMDGKFFITTAISLGALFNSLRKP